MQSETNSGASDPYEGLIAPQRRNLWSEVRSTLEPLRLAQRTRHLLRDVPRGGAELVVAIPGYGTGDTFTAPLRAYLSNRGYSSRGWQLGRNHGDVERLLPQVHAKLERYVEYHGDKAALVGWSLGGVIARELARDYPNLVSQVVTFGTPVVGGPKYTVSAASYRERGVDVEKIAARITERNLIAIDVPITAIFSKTDGVVTWQACIDHFSPSVEHIEIDSSHAGMPINPDVFELVARALLTSSDPT
ncbi:MAG: alpha/beta hydrolase [Acidimicrobiales bacterium]